MNWHKAYIKAIEMAALAHDGARRKFADEPYFLHPLRVSEIVLDRTGNFELACVAVLHDTLEDTKLQAEEIYSAFNENVVALVESVTKNKSISKAESEAEYLKRFAASSVETVILKLADRLDNVRDLTRTGTPPHFRESYIKNTVSLLCSTPPVAAKNEAVCQLKAEIIKCLSEAREMAAEAR